MQKTEIHLSYCFCNRYYVTCLLTFNIKSVEDMILRIRRILFCQFTRKSYQIIQQQMKATVAKPAWTLCKAYAGLLFTWPSRNNNENTCTKPSVLDHADKIFENGRYEECYNLLISCKDQNDIEIIWRTCRALYNMSKEGKYEASYKRQLITKAYQMIAGELDKNWDNHAVHKWYALVLDAKSSYAGMTEKIEQLENVKKHMDLAATLDPSDASTLHMLGEWCYQVAEVPWLQRRTAAALFAPLPRATLEDALGYYLRAEAARPRFYSVNLLRIGTCYMRLDREDQAKYYLQLAASYPAKSNDDHMANKKARELLKKLK